MILLLSGEGPSDMGVSRSPAGASEGDEFEPGPMAWVVNKLVEPVWNYSPLETASCILVSEATLSLHCRSRRMGTVLPGRKKPKETAYFFKNARGLAQLARERATRDNCAVGAVLFRDSDGIVGSHRSLWDDKVRSMVAGFDAEDFELGVPMLPKPKSEVWLLCAVQEVRYQNCARFESMSGNDASPNSAKAALSKALQAAGCTQADVCDLVQRGYIDPRQIIMPSFDLFRKRLEEVARKMVSTAGLPSGG